MNVKTLALAALALPLLAGSAFAHHSFAMFDPSRKLTQTGTVKELEWTNPHVWIHVMAPDATGKEVEWSFEMQAVAQAMSGGWRRDSVKAGDKITIEFFPLKDGSRGGELIAAVLPDGKRLPAQAGRLPIQQAP